MLAFRQRCAIRPGLCAAGIAASIFLYCRLAGRGAPSYRRARRWRV